MSFEVATTGAETTSSKVRRYMPIRKPVIAFAVAAFALAVVATLNPGNLLARRSAKFSVAVFERVKVGDPVQSVIAVLGEPLEIQPAGNIGECFECSVYLFLGKPPRWALRYEEAWALVDKQGLVVRKVRTLEP